MGKDERDGIRAYQVGALDTNCYVLVENGRALVVDPGASGDALADALEQEHLTVEAIVCTHGHHDHVGGVAALKRRTNAPFLIGVADAERARHALSLSSHAFVLSDPTLEDAPEADRVLAEGDVVRLGTHELRVLDAPGHTEGGIVLLGEGFAFVGDTIFCGSVGRTDLRGGDAQTLAATLAHLVERIPPETVLLCGHGPSTTMASELAHNPWFAGLG